MALTELFMWIVEDVPVLNKGPLRLQISPSIQTVASLLALRYNSSTRQLTNRRSLLTSCRRWIRLQNANIVPLSRNLQTHPAIPGEKGRKRGVVSCWQLCVKPEEQDLSDGTQCENVRNVFFAASNMEVSRYNKRSCWGIVGNYDVP